MTEPGTLDARAPTNPAVPVTLADLAPGTARVMAVVVRPLADDDASGRRTHQCERREPHVQRARDNAVGTRARGHQRRPGPLVVRVRRARRTVR